MNKLKEFLRTIQWTWMAVAFAFAVVLWIYVVTVVNPNQTETFNNVPVVFDGEDALRESGFIITEGNSATVKLTITGKRSAVANLSSDNITVSVDVSRINSAGSYDKTYTISYPASVTTTGLTVEQKTPATVSFKVEALMTVELPVKVQWSGTVAEGHILDSCQATVESVRVTGTEAQVESLERALVLVDDENVSSTIDMDYPLHLMNKDGDEVSDLSELTLEYDEVRVVAKILVTKEVPLALEIVAGGGATESNISYEIEPATIEISGEEETLRSINKIVIDTLNLVSVDSSGTMKKNILLPDGVNNVTGTLQADVSYTLVGLSRRTLQATDIEFESVPAGYHAIAITEIIPITLRGSSSEINNIQASDIRIIADLSAFSGSEGTYTCEDVRIAVSGAPNCGTTENYSVVFTMMTEEAYQALMAEEAEDSTQ